MGVAIDPFQVVYFGRPLSFLHSPPSFCSVEAVEAAERFRSGPSVPGPGPAPPAVRALHLSVRELETSRGGGGSEGGPLQLGRLLWSLGLAIRGPISRGVALVAFGGGWDPKICHDIDNPVWIRSM